jgi:hypothetical protein
VPARLQRRALHLDGHRAGPDAAGRERLLAGHDVDRPAVFSKLLAAGVDPLEDVLAPALPERVAERARGLLVAARSGARGRIGVGGRAAPAARRAERDQAHVAERLDALLTMRAVRDPHVAAA